MAPFGAPQPVNALLQGHEAAFQSQEPCRQIERVAADAVHLWRRACKPECLFAFLSADSTRMLFACVSLKKDGIYCILDINVACM